MNDAARRELLKRLDASIQRTELLMDVVNTLRLTMYGIDDVNRKLGSHVQQKR